MASDNRFYLLEFRNRPVFYGDIGSLFKIKGIAVGGGGAEAILLLPGETLSDPKQIELSLEEWSDFIRRSDIPEILIGPAKAFQRKLRWEISGAVQQKVWAKDGFKCMYCGYAMGQGRVMSVDHFIPLELGGKNDESNYLTACRPCNKDKGSENPNAWCARKGLNYDYFVGYLETRTF